MNKAPINRVPLYLCIITLTVIIVSQITQIIAMCAYFKF